MDILPILDNKAPIDIPKGKVSDDLNNPSSGPVVRSPSVIPPPPVSQQEAQDIPILGSGALHPSAESGNTSPSAVISVVQPSVSPSNPSPVANTPSVVSTVIPSVTALPTPPVGNTQSIVVPTNSDSSQPSNPTPSIPGSNSIPNLAQPSFPTSSTTSPGLVGSFNLTNDPNTNQIVTISIWAGVGLIIFIGIITCIRRINRRKKGSSTNNLLFRPNDFGPTPPMTRSATTVTNGGMKSSSAPYAVSAADLNEAIRIEKEALRIDDEQQRAAAAMAAGLVMSHPITSPPQQHGGVYVIPNNITGSSSSSNNNSSRPGMLLSTQPPQPTAGVMSYPVPYRPIYYNHPDTVQYNNNSIHDNPILSNGSTQPMYMPVSTSSPYMMPAMMGTPILANGSTPPSSSIIIGGGGNAQYLPSSSVPIHNQVTGESISSGIPYVSSSSSSSPPSSSLPIPPSTQHMENVRHRIVNVPTGKVQYHNKRPAPEAPIPPLAGSGFPHSSSTYDLANNDL